MKHPIMKYNVLQNGQNRDQDTSENMMKERKLAWYSGIKSQYSSNNSSNFGDPGWGST